MRSERCPQYQRLSVCLVCHFSVLLTVFVVMGQELRPADNLLVDQLDGSLARGMFAYCREILGVGSINSLRQKQF